MAYTALVLVLVGLDQLVKYLVMKYIPLGGHLPFLPHLMELTYVQNTGAAFSMLSEHTWLLTLVSLVLTVLLAWALHREVFRHPIGKTAIAMLLAGAAGNLIDRAFRHFVVDMFNVTFMTFAVFNVADICVVLGGILAAVYYLFLRDRLEGEKEDHEDTETDT